MLDRKPISPNPQRALVIGGEIHLGLIEKLLLDIHRFKADSREPITLYIHSPGGQLEAADQLLALIRSGENSCPIVSVATTFAASAAALILSQSDYAWAYPNCGLLYHGPRLNAAELTRERADDIHKSLDSKANDLARTLARTMFPRTLQLMRIWNSHALDGLADIEKADGGIEGAAGQLLQKCESKILPCWIVLISKQLSPPARQVLEEALQKTLHFMNLLQHEQLFTPEILEPVLRKVFLFDAANLAAQSLVESKQLEGLDANAQRNKVSDHAGEIFRQTLPETSHARDLAALLTAFSKIAPFVESETTEECWLRVFRGFLEMRRFRTRKFIRDLGENVAAYAPSFLPQEACDWLKANPRDSLTEESDVEQFDALLGKLHQEIYPIYLFTTAIAQSLQTADFSLTTKDALLFGLIDAIWGGGSPPIDPSQPLAYLD